MTYGELFREVWLELHPNLKGDLEFQLADSMVPAVVKEEVPPDKVEQFRKEYLEIGRKIDNSTDDEVLMTLRKKTSLN